MMLEVKISATSIIPKLFERMIFFEFRERVGLKVIFYWKIMITVKGILILQSHHRRINGVSCQLIPVQSFEIEFRCHFLLVFDYNYSGILSIFQ